MAYLQVTATVADYGSWHADFEAHHDRRAEHGGSRYQVFRSVENPDEITVLLEFDAMEDARAWNDYLTEGDGTATAGLSDVEFRYLDCVEEGMARLST